MMILCVPVFTTLLTLQCPLPLYCMNILFRTKPSGQVSNSYIDYHWRPDYKLEIPDNHQLTDTPQGTLH